MACITPVLYSLHSSTLASECSSTLERPTCVSQTASPYRIELISVVNYIGCARVVDNLESKYASTYEHASVKNFTDVKGRVTGWTKSAGKGAGNIAFVSFHNAGHMVSFRLDEASTDV